MLRRGVAGSLISRRSAKLAELAQEIAQFEEESKSIREELIEAAPENLREWIENEDVLSSVLKYGLYDFKICFNENGFGDIEDTVRKLKGLSKAWKGIVRIEIDKYPESHRVAVKFIVVI